MRYQIQISDPNKLRLQAHSKYPTQSNWKESGFLIQLLITSSKLSSYENGKQIIEITSPSFLGGNGNRLDPMGYCVAGIASCFIATFVTIAAGRGVRLTKLTANVECKINFAKTFDVSDEPITEGITFKIDAVSDNADKSKLQELLKMAEERCPAVYSMFHIVNVEATITCMNW